jgi:hypothetical protein
MHNSLHAAVVSTLKPLGSHRHASPYRYTSGDPPPPHTHTYTFLVLRAIAESDRDAVDAEAQSFASVCSSALQVLAAEVQGGVVTDADIAPGTRTRNE